MILGASIGLAIALAPIASTETETPSEASERPSLDCSLGPVERFYDGVQWYVFGCDDGETIVFFTGPKSPSDLQFYFLVFPEDGRYKVYGEGNGDQALTRPAYEAITAMTSADYIALHAEASAVSQ